MRYVVSAAEMRSLDAATIEQLGLPGAVLMENAGRRVAQVIVERIERQTLKRAARIAVICGAGNNGGDGYVIARYLRDHAFSATVYLAAARDKLRGDAKLHHDVYVAMGHPVRDAIDHDSLAACADDITSADIVVDCLFGTGLTRDITGHYRAVVETINRGRGTVVAVDLPSGLSCDTGRVLGVQVHAHVTVTLAFLKLGLAMAPGFASAGDVQVAEIGIPEQLAYSSGVRVLMSEARDMAKLVPTMRTMDHKNRRGHVLAVAGSTGKRGAARLLARAALRTGAGLITLAWPHAGGEPTAPDPVMTAALDETDNDTARTRLLELAHGKQALAMGPGMSTTAHGRCLVQAALAELEIPMVLDADALNHVGTSLDSVRRARAPVIMTPHPGEAARLLGTSPADIEADRLASVRRLADSTEAVIVLKGARTLICSGLPDARCGRVVINPTGNPGLATAGSGDVLTGIVAALLAQGMDAFDAACLAAYIHGQTGELTTTTLGTMHAVTAADLPDAIPRAVAELTRSSDDTRENGR